MKQLKVVEKIYYDILIIIIASLLIFNFYMVFASHDYMGFTAIAIQSFLIYLLISKNPNAQKIIKIWLVIFFFIASGLRILGLLLEMLEIMMEGKEEFIETEYWYKILRVTLLILIGVVMWMLNKGFGNVAELDPTNE